MQRSAILNIRVRAQLRRHRAVGEILRGCGRSPDYPPRPMLGIYARMLSALQRTTLYRRQARAIGVRAARIDDADERARLLVIASLYDKLADLANVVVATPPGESREDGGETN